MNKRGQVTIFIILAILIVVAALSYFLFRDTITSRVGNVGGNEVNIYVQNCLEQVTEGAVLEVGQGGGYFERPEFSTSNGITYYYGENEEFHFFLKDGLEEEVSLAVGAKLNECVGSFSEFGNYDKINAGNISVSSEILDEKIKIFVDYPIQLIKGDDVLMLTDFEYEISSRLGLIYEVVDKMVYEEPLKKGICLSCNFDHALESGLNIDYFDYGENTVIFVVTDNEIKLGENSFEFIFANDYSEENGI